MLITLSYISNFANTHDMERNRKPCTYEGYVLRWDSLSPVLRDVHRIKVILVHTKTLQKSQLFVDI